MLCLSVLLYLRRSLFTIAHTPLHQKCEMLNEGFPSRTVMCSVVRMYIPASENWFVMYESCKEIKHRSIISKHIVGWRNGVDHNKHMDVVTFQILRMF